MSGERVFESGCRHEAERLQLGVPGLWSCPCGAFFRSREGDVVYAWRDSVLSEVREELQALRRKVDALEGEISWHRASRVFSIYRSLFRRERGRSPEPLSPRKLDGLLREAVVAVTAFESGRKSQ